MKKFAIITAAIFMSVALIAPAMAVELEVTGGEFRMQGFNMSNGSSTLTDGAASNAYYDFWLIPEITLTVNDSIKINTRVAIVDENLGGDETVAKGTTAEWDRAWATLLTDYGKFDIGRMSGGTFGINTFETVATRDRIKWTMPVDNFIFLGVIEKNAELDGTDTTDATSDDNDYDVYYAAGIYKVENIEAGLLVGHAINATDPTGTKTFQVFNPYCNININDTYGVKAEVHYLAGEFDADDDDDDSDISGLGFFIAGTGNFGQTKVEVGYMYASGDDESDDDSTSLKDAGGGGGYNAGMGDEWTPFVILQDANMLLDDLDGDGASDNTYGVNLFYAQADYALSDDMTLTGMLGFASASDTPEDYDKSYGTEIDAKLEWRLTDALTYNFNLGYLMAGDFFKLGDDAAEIEDTFTVYHKLQIDF
mgnify:FL=1